MSIEVANRLATLRRRRGLSQEQLAEKLGISRQAISKWERAESSPDTDNLIALARLYQISLDELVKLDDTDSDDELLDRMEARAREAEAEDAGEEDDEDDDDEDDEICEDDVIEEMLEHVEALGEVIEDLTDDIRKVSMDEEGNRHTVTEGDLGVSEKVERPDGSWTWKWDTHAGRARAEVKSEGRMSWYQFPYPVLVVIVYLIIGFMFNMWHPGWMLFLTIPIYYTAIEGDGFNLNRVPYALVVSIVYLIIGFAWSLWHPGWMLFLTIPFYYTLGNRFISGTMNMVLIGVGVVAVFWLLGMSFGRWNTLWFAMIGIALCVLGIMKTQDRIDKE